MDRRSTPYISVFLLTFIMFSFLFGCSGKDNNISDASASDQKKREHAPIELPRPVELSYMAMKLFL